MKIEYLQKCFIVVFGVLLLWSCSKHQLTDEQYVERAKNHQEQNQPRAAIIELKNALQVNPKNIVARKLLGQIYISVGDGESGEKELARAIELGASPNEVNIPLARAQLLQGKYQEIIDKFGNEENIELIVAVAEAYMGLDDIKSAEAYITKAKAIQGEALFVKLAMVKLSLMKADYDQTDNLLKEILGAEPENMEAWRYKGILAMQQTRFNEAEEAFQKVINLDKTDVLSANSIQSWLGLIQSQLAQKESEKAEQNLNQLHRKSLNHPGIDYLAALLAYEKGDFESARTNLQKLNAKLPNYLPGILLLGASHYALGSYEQAAVYLSRYVNEVPSNLHARKLLAATRIKQRRPKDALEILEVAEDSAPDDIQLIAMIGQASVTSGNIIRGTEYLKKAKAANPNDPSIRAELAHVLMSQGAFDQAIRELEAIADKFSKPRDVMIVSAYLRKKDYANARKVAKQLTLDNPGPDTEIVLGSVELISGARTAARIHFENALKSDKGYIPAIINLGKMDLEEGNFNQAAEHFESVLSRQSDNVQAYFGLAQVAEKQGNRQKALTYIEKAREANANSPLPRLILARYYLKTGDMNKALTIVEEFNENHMKEPAIMLLTGKVYRSAGQLEKSVDVFKNLVSKLPKEPGVYLELANSQLKMGRTEDAKQSLNKALGLKKDFLQASYALAQIDFRDGDTSKALALAQQIQRQHDQSPLGFILAGDIYLHQEKFDKARQQYEKANKRQPSSLLTLKLASTYSSKKQYDEAIAILNSWLKKNPDDSGIQMAVAQEYQKMGRLAQSIDIMEQLLAKEPDNAVVLNNLAWMFHLNHDPRALKFAERAHELRPEVGTITDTLGWLLVENDKQLPRAVDLLRDAVKKTPNVIEIKYHLSVALYKSGNKKEAKELLTEVVAANEYFSDKSNAKKLLDSIK
jgi:putative PEP-CTERM system TPR-repeat lipoprotein